VVLAVALYVTLPERYTVGPVWLLPVLELAILIPLTIAMPRRQATEEPWHRVASISLIALVNAANILSLVLLVDQLLNGGNKVDAGQLIGAALQIWGTNVLVFGLWYWELDRGGPSARMGKQERPPDFLFPQMSSPKIAGPDWHPGFVDYMYLACTNAMAFSPTDTMPLTPWAKMLMLVQSLVSLLTVVLVAARAVNILQ
jgi:uncharacterized membrane protein